MIGGREGIRTPDPLLAKQVLSQLSYTPTACLLFILRQIDPIPKCFAVLASAILRRPILLMARQFAESMTSRMREVTLD